jgi:Zn-dependent protease
MSAWDARTSPQRTLYRPSGIFLALVALLATSGWMAWAEFGNVKVDVFLFVVAGWVISLCLHEYSHAVLALRGGDRGVIDRGYLTLNPLRYAHPVLSIVLPLLFVVIGGIALPGGAVWVNHDALRGPRARSFVSLAGPAANLLCALLLGLPFAIGVTVADHEPFWAGVAFLGYLQLMAAILNLLPIPGVDGGNMIEPWLSPQWQRGFAMVAPYGMLVLFMLLWTPRAAGPVFDIVDGTRGVIGLPRGRVGPGYELFRFWAF